MSQNEKMGKNGVPMNSKNHREIKNSKGRAGAVAREAGRTNGPDQWNQTKSPQLFTRDQLINHRKSLIDWFELEMKAEKDPVKIAMNFKIISRMKSDLIHDSLAGYCERSDGLFYWYSDKIA